MSGVVSCEGFPSSSGGAEGELVDAHHISVQECCARAVHQLGRDALASVTRVCPDTRHSTSRFKQIVFNMQDLRHRNDEPTGGFGAEYQWCGEWRVRAAALQAAEGRVATAVRRVSNDQALVVDGDEDTELYGPPQYSPSRIAPDVSINTKRIP
ncbi:hypothetical protein RR48_04691 [Papilio machaon]|uniref:E3 ubiquitin-protein ligase RNF220 middle domain-containing protein n=1 Tax=Papilio machaon TaxID=76193 RepID=A0A0N0PER2_PAPMA|nr:hypothetical protein RR48_04691 [Papilio machaon]